MDKPIYTNNTENKNWYLMPFVFALLASDNEKSLDWKLDDIKEKYLEYLNSMDKKQ